MRREHRLGLYLCVDQPSAASKESQNDAGKGSQAKAFPKLPNGPRLSCGALKKDSFHNLRAPPASSAC
jgi:hypothetical protein